MDNYQAVFMLITLISGFSIKISMCCSTTVISKDIMVMHTRVTLAA